MYKHYYNSPVGTLEIICENNELISENNDEMIQENSSENINQETENINNEESLIPDLSQTEIENQEISGESKNEDNFSELTELNNNADLEENDDDDDFSDFMANSELMSAATFSHDDDDDKINETENENQFSIPESFNQLGIISNSDSDEENIYDSNNINNTEDFNESPNFDEFNNSNANSEFKDLDEQHKEITMNIRDKLKTKQDANKPVKTSRGGLLTPLLLIVLVVIAVLCLMQLKNITDRLAMSGFANNTVFESSLPEANAAYDYAIDFVLDPDITSSMSKRGREGWQVVGSRRTQDTTTGQYGYEFIFMRKVPSR